MQKNVNFKIKKKIKKNRAKGISAISTINASKRRQTAAKRGNKAISKLCKGLQYCEVYASVTEWDQDITSEI